MRLAGARASGAGTRGDSCASPLRATAVARSDPQSLNWELYRPAGRWSLLFMSLRRCLESFPAFQPCLVRAHPGRPAAPPTATGWGEELLERAVLHRPHGPGRSYIGRTGPGGATLAARGYSESSQDVTIRMSAHAPQPEPIRARIDWRT